MGMIAHHGRHIRSCQIRHFDPSQLRHDMAINLPLIGLDGARLVAHLRILFDKLNAQILDRRCLSGGLLGRAGVKSFADVRHPVLGNAARLIYRQLTVQTDLGLAAFAGIRAILEHEYLAAGGGDFAQKARHQGVTQFVVFACCTSRVNSGFCEFDGSHTASFQGKI